MNCPKSQSARIIKYGHTYYGKPRFRCRDCPKAIVFNIKLNLPFSGDRFKTSG